MILPAEAAEYVRYQRSGCRSLEAYRASVLRDANEIIPYLPNSVVRSFADIGCGIGGLTALIAWYLRDPEVHLIDRSELPPKPFFGFRDRACFYNSLDLAAETVRLNAPGAEVFVHEATDGYQIAVPDGSLDLIISTLAVGFHMPWTTYRPEIDRTLRRDGSLILDLRNGTEQYDEFSERFDHVVTIATTRKYTRVIGRDHETRPNV